MKKLIIIFLLFPIGAIAQEKLKTQNVFLITLDGFRWQEMFSGADSLLIDDSGYVEHPESLVNQFWDENKMARREKLLPFFTKTIGSQGQLYGNRKHDNFVNCSNQRWFSYPGYSEILCGFADDERITSNDKVPNPNKTVLEFINQQPGFKGKVVAFGSWDVFPFIINEERSGVPVNAGFENAEDDGLSAEEILLNQLQSEIRSPWGTVRLDAFTHHFAMEYIKKHEPRVVYIAYGETDDFAHDGHYDEYLKSAHQTDQYIASLWDYIQSTDVYKDKTTIIITTDHGRGTHPKDTWKSHGKNIDGAGQIWIAALGPDIKPLGEVRMKQQLYQNQIAATVASLLGLTYVNERETGRAIVSIAQHLK